MDLELSFHGYVVLQALLLMFVGREACAWVPRKEDASGNNIVPGTVERKLNEWRRQRESVTSKLPHKAPITQQQWKGQ